MSLLKILNKIAARQDYEPKQNEMLSLNVTHLQELHFSFFIFHLSIKNDFYKRHSSLHIMYFLSWKFIFFFLLTQKKNVLNLNISFIHSAKMSFIENETFK